MYYKNMQYYVFENQFFTHFLAQFMWHTWKKMSCIGNFFFILFHFISSLLSSLTTFMMDHAVTFFLVTGSFYASSSFSFSFSFNASFFIINDEVKRKERKEKKRVEFLNIFSTHNMLFYFISYVRNVIVVEGQYFTKIFFCILFHIFF